MRYIFIVSQAVVAEDPGAKAGVQIEVLKAEGQKYKRWLNYSIEVGEDKAYPEPCEDVPR